MTYKEIVALLVSNGWTTTKVHNGTETWQKGHVVIVLRMEDKIPKGLVNAIIASA